MGNMKLVDGQVRFNPIEKRKISEPFNVDVPLGRDDRFLTLVVTKGEISGSGNRMVIAEPILHIGD